MTRIRGFLNQADFGTYYADEWLKRGIGLYGDVQHPRPVSNPWTSAAYELEDGRTQKAVAFWNHRAYLKRIWQRMQYWRRNQEQPLDFCIHHTGTQILPLWTWGTIDYTLELTPECYALLEGGKPFPPDYIRTINVGRQVGSHPYLVKHLFRYDRETLAGERPPLFSNSREWGMRMIHEINRGHPHAAHGWDRAVFGFGYGMPEVRVHNYWADDPVLAVSNPDVKWICLARKTSRALTEQIDMLPTTLGLCGCSTDNLPVAGRDRSAELRSGEVVSAPYVFSEIEVGPERTYMAMARSATHKLVQYRGREDDAPVYEFYDCEADPYENETRAGDPAFGERIAAHRQALCEWMAGGRGPT